MSTQQIFVKTLEMLEVLHRTARVQLAFPKLPTFALITPAELCVAVPSCGSPWTSVIHGTRSHIFKPSFDEYSARCQL